MRLFLVLCCLLLAGAARADQTDERLDGLFARLRAPDAAEAGTVEATIWRVWAITRTEEAILPFRRGVAAMEEGRLPEALAAFDDVVAKAPEFAEGWNKRATVLYLLRRYDESAADVARTLALEPRHFGALAGLGLIRRAQDRDAEALAAFERGLAVNPHMEQIAGAVRTLRTRVRGRAI
ncbi:MAG: tetratricopeptide repeat protein [Alphaproteobacteria bacterium]|nr:tetratricopeptide repeat protein [Alphaproteobacteria bacterium]